jgi:hypothetical protein
MNVRRRAVLKEGRSPPVLSGNELLYLEPGHVHLEDNGSVIRDIGIILEQDADGRRVRKDLLRHFRDTGQVIGYAVFGRESDHVGGKRQGRSGG